MGKIFTPTYSPNKPLSEFLYLNLHPTIYLGAHIRV